MIPAKVLNNPQGLPAIYRLSVVRAYGKSNQPFSMSKFEGAILACKGMLEGNGALREGTFAITSRGLKREQKTRMDPKVQKLLIEFRRLVTLYNKQKMKNRERGKEDPILAKKFESPKSGGPTGPAELMP